MRDSIVIMLAGSIRPSPLRRSLGEPALCLPLSRTQRLIDIWLRVIAAALAETRVRIVVSDESDCRAIRSALAESSAPGAPNRDPSRSGTPALAIEVVTESASWRGSGGVLCDVTSDCDGLNVLAVEAATLPPATLAPVISRLGDPTANASAVVAAGTERDPAGVYLFRSRALAHLRRVGEVGYHDLKEQVIPDLAEAGHQIVPALTGSQVIRLRDREAYLHAVRAVAAGRYSNGEPGVRSDEKITHNSSGELGVRSHEKITDNSSLITHDSSPRVLGCSIVERGAAIGRGAVVYDSVILRGATIGESAVVARSIVGRGCVIEPHARIIDDIARDTASVGDVSRRGRPRDTMPEPAHSFNARPSASRSVVGPGARQNGSEQRARGRAGSQPAEEFPEITEQHD